MWKPYCIWCVSINVCILCCLSWMCNEVAETSIQQYRIYELLTSERRGFNTTPSWNNSASLAHSPAPLASSSLSKLHTQSRWSDLRHGPKRKSGGPPLSCIKLFCDGLHEHIFFKLYHKYEAVSRQLKFHICLKTFFLSFFCFFLKHAKPFFCIFIQTQLKSLIWP